MLKIKVKIDELFDEETQEFVDQEVELVLEHSLVSLSKWESKFKVPFLGRKDKTDEQTLGYIEAMCLSPEPADILDHLSQENIDQINAYITDPQTATWFTDKENRRFNREIITAEVIYYLMASYNIPVKFEAWHLNRLLTLIRVFNEKNQPKKKISRAEQLQKQRELNRQRRDELGSTG